MNQDGSAPLSGATCAACCASRCCPLEPGETVCLWCRLDREERRDVAEALLPDGIPEIGCGGPTTAELVWEMRRVLGEDVYRRLFFRVRRRKAKENRGGRTLASCRAEFGGNPDMDVPF